MSNSMALPLDSFERYQYLKDNPIPKLHEIPDSPMPDWILPLEDPPEPPRALTHKTFENMFELVCEQISGGDSLDQILNRDPRSPDVGKFIRWVMRDESRKNKYYEAMAIQAEIILASDMLRIADADESLEDVQRSRLKLETRWKYMAICNRDRFGDKKQVDQNITIDLGDAMEKARSRSRMIDVSPSNQDNDE